MFFRRSILDLYVKFSVSRELCSSLVSFILFVLVYPICNSPPSVLPVSMLCHLLHCTCSTSSLVDSSCELLSLYALTMHTPSPRSPLLSPSLRIHRSPAPLFLEFLHLVDVQPSASVSLFLSLLTLPYHPIYSASFMFFSCHDVYAIPPLLPSHSSISSTQVNHFSYMLLCLCSFIIEFPDRSSLVVHSFIQIFFL